MGEISLGSNRVTQRPDISCFWVQMSDATTKLLISAQSGCAPVALLLDALKTEPWSFFQRLHFKANTFFRIVG